MPLPFALRASQSADANLFYNVTEQTMRAHVLAAGGTWDEERRRRESVEDSANPNASIILVGAIEAGILVVERWPHEVHLQDLYLLPKYQGQGIGSALVSALQKEAIARCVSLRLQVLKVNSAKRFYERLGFSVLEETEYFFHMQYDCRTTRIGRMP